MKKIMFAVFYLAFIFGLNLFAKPWKEIEPYFSDVQQVPPESTFEWEFDVQANRQTFLTISTRQMSEHKMGGYNFSIQFRVNGEPLRSRLNRQTPLLLNRPDSFTARNGNIMNYDSGDSSWLAIFSNSYENSPASVGITDPEPYTYVLDISSYLKPGKNVFSARNLRDKNNLVKFIEVKLELRSREIPVSELAKATASAPVFVKPSGLFFDQLGALHLSGTGQNLRLASSFSQPGGGFNHLGKDGSADKNWSWKQSNESGKVARLTAYGPGYQVERQASLEDNRLRIIDTLCNLSKEDLVLRYEHAIVFDEFMLPVCRMGGQESHSLNNYHSTSNSTIFYPATNSGLGIAIEDDFSRNHAQMFYDDQSRLTGFRNDSFYLEPGDIYNVEWSLYISPSDDYYDFLNQVRRDWNLNYTIEGPVYFVGTEEVFNTPVEKLKEYFETKKAKYLSFWEIRTSPDAKIPEADGKAVIGYGEAVFSKVLEKPRLRQIEAANRWRELFPQAKVTQYYHCFFQSLEKPDDMTHQDSFMVGVDGKRVEGHYSDKIWYARRPIYPMPGNSFWQVHMDSLDFLFDDMKVDWLYWDESNGPGTTAKDRAGGASVTFNAEDGHSALIDLENNQIIKKCGILAMISAPALKEGLKRIRQKNGIVLFNGSPTLKYRTQPGVYNMAETQDVVSRAYNTHLGTPLAFGFGAPAFSNIVERLDYACLYVRTFLHYHSDAVSKFYPFTPIELHRGWLKGVERVVTNRSGNYGWEGEFTARLWRYDEDGKKLEEEPDWQNFTDQAGIEVPKGGLAILERKIN